MVKHKKASIAVALVILIVLIGAFVHYQRNQQQEAFESFIKDYASLNGEAAKAVADYRRTLESGNAEAAYDEADNAYAFVTEAISALWELEVPPDLPKGVRAELESALTNIKESHRLRKLEMETAKKLIEKHGDPFDEKELKTLEQSADRHASEAVDSILSAGKRLHLPSEEIERLLLKTHR
ncbi:hypothetical protein [Bacillus sp. Marseille-Q3570]|uniref:hypothetical protein n=1 Tax=Bacillus sp. Marseille-Q3570 TaxID=2963522 RepID=UPI0021B8471B|nr:hypothetical protein [Bacillus sp. Marseille-Q3570]